MNSINALSYSASSAQHFSFTKRFPHNSFSVKRRRSRRNRNTRTSDVKRSLPNNDQTNDNESLKLVLDVNHISSLTDDAFHDLKTLITLDNNNRIVVSCRKSTLWFTSAVLLCGFVLVSAIRVLIRLRLGFRSRFRVANKNNVVVRRDRSLGGREVVVAMGTKEDFKRKKSPSVLDNSSCVFESELGRDEWRRYSVRNEGKLPTWWSVSVTKDQDLVVHKQEYQREANRLVRAIADHRTSGKDVTEHDIIQLRRICRTSGVQVSFDTTNTRDAFYRASINYILHVCSSTPSYSTFIQIDGEDAQQFIVGLAENIGLENVRAARMVSAAVAARTRSCFLQAWMCRRKQIISPAQPAHFVLFFALLLHSSERTLFSLFLLHHFTSLEVQGKHSEAVLELSKICLVLQTFPPEESSPEMEMVARGLGKHLPVKQREVLMSMFVSVCSEESHRSAADALGLGYNLKFRPRSGP